MSDEKEQRDSELTGQDVLPGEALRRARENHGWSVAEVAGKLHLTESAVCSLEADRYQELPGITFVRGYIRTYAKLAGLDADALAKQYSGSVKTPEIEPIKALPDLGRRVARSRSRGRLAMALLLLVLMAALVAGYFWWQEEYSQPADAGLAGEVPFSQVEIERVDGTLYVQSLDELDAYTAELDIAEISLDSLQPPLPAETAESAATLADVGDESADSGLEAAVEGAEDGSVASTEDDGEPVEPGKHRLELAFTSDCWIRITDGSGSEVASGLYHAGAVLQLSGDTPFELHLGNAGGVQLTFNGQPVDISSSIRGNVARIKLG